MDSQRPISSAGRNVAVAALRVASCASFVSTSAVVSVLICPLAPTAIAVLIAPRADRRALGLLDDLAEDLLH
jgi:hypothetical protein